ncbi:MAG: hypothetical protein EpisKO_26880 [Epibacterium sp.]
MGAKDLMRAPRLQGHAKRLLDIGRGLGKCGGGNGKVIKFHGDVLVARRISRRHPSKSRHNEKHGPANIVSSSR